MKRLFILFIVFLLPAGIVFSQKKETYRVRTVVIDPGHGGAKPGAQGSRSQEKAITLSVAKKFGKLIQDNYSDVKVIYTRTTDVDISLAERARIANRNKADLFISIHANSHPTSSPNGVETFVMGLSESRANLEVAKKENADILLEADYKNNADYSGFDPNSPESYVLLAMFQNAYLDKSLNFAQAIQKQYMRNLKTIDRGVKQAELFVLYKTAMPSVLTEIGFISNPAEEAFMLSDEGQAKIAISLFNAFMNFKATEEGSNRITNPKIDLPGYRAPASQKQEPAPTAQEVASVEPEPVAEKTTEPEQPKVQPKEEAPAPEVKKPEPQPEPVKPQPEPAKMDPKPVQTQPEEVQPQPEPAKPQAKPTPTVELPQQPVQQPKEETKPDSKVTPQSETKPETKPEPKTEAKPEPEVKKETLLPPNNTADADATTYYTVQFLIHPTLFKAGAAKLDGVSDFQAVKQDKGYVYTTGRFRTQQEAVNYCAHIKRTTSFKDAWAYQYKAPQQAAAETNAASVTKPADTPAAKPSAPVKGLTYRVQLCSASRLLKAGDPELQGIKDIHYTQNDKYYVYSAGDYPTEQEARQRCKKIKSSTTFRDAFVIAIYNGERITLEQAAAIRKKK